MDHPSRSPSPAHPPEVASPRRDEGDSELERLFARERPDAYGALPPPAAAGALAQFQDRFTLGRCIGQGAMGTVYEAHEQDSGRRVALKMLRRHNAAQLYRLKNEFRLIADVAHPNVVEVYELFGAADDWFFTMELVDGVPIDTALRAQPAAAGTRWSLLRRWIAEIVSAVSAVHDAGLLHRDLKPSNVLIDARGRVRVLDFGLVSEQHAGGVGQTVDAVLTGTPAYMAPEQAAGQRATTASDWYALGVIVYELLTGRLPHLGAMPQLLVLKQTQAIVSPRALAAHAPRDLSELCVSLLRVEPAQRLGRDALLELTRSWLERAPHADPMAFAPSALRRPAFVGRAAALTQLERCRERAHSQPVALVIEGASGVGKSALIQEACARFVQADPRCCVLAGRCFQREAVPFKAFDGLIDALTRVLIRWRRPQLEALLPDELGALVGLFPVLQRIEAIRSAARAYDGDAHVQRELAFGAARQLFCRLAQHQALVCVIEDMQWRDEPSLQLLAALLSGPDAPRLLLVLSTRPGHGQAIDAALSDLRCERMLLEPLGVDDARELARQLLAAQDPPRPELADTIAAESTGVPLYALELVRELSANVHGLRRADLRALLGARIARVSPSGQRLLRLLAIAARPLPESCLETCFERGEWSESVRQLQRAQLVQTTHHGEIELFHDRVREAVLGPLDGAARAALHQQVALLLRQLPDVEPEWLIVHHQGAGERAEAAACALLAARRAARALAFERAVELFRLALELGAWSAAQEAELMEERALALAHAGRATEAGRVYLRAASFAPQCTQRLQRLGGAQLLRGGHLDEGEAVLRSLFQRMNIGWPAARFSLAMRGSARRSLRPYAPKPPNKDAATPERIERLDALQIATSLFSFDPLQAAAFSALAWPLAHAVGEPKRLLLALAGESVYLTMLFGTDADGLAAQLYAAVVELAKRDRGYYDAAAADGAAALCAFYAGRWDQASVLCKRAMKDLEGRVAGAAWEVTTLYAVQQSIAIHDGSLARERALSEARLAKAQLHDDLYAQLTMLRRIASACLLDDDPAAATATLQRAELAIAHLPRVFARHLLIAARLAVELYTEQLTAADESYAALQRECARLGVARFPLVRLLLFAAKANCLVHAAGLAPQRRARRLERLADAIARLPIAWAPGLAHSLRAEAARLHGELATAGAQLGLAISRYEACGMELDAHVLRLRLAGLWSDAAGFERAQRALHERGVRAPLRLAGVIHLLF